MYRRMIPQAQVALPSAKIYVIEPNWVDSRPYQEKNNMKHFVQWIPLQKLPTNLIPKLNSSKLKIYPPDQYKIHCAMVTAYHWLEHVSENLT